MSNNNEITITDLIGTPLGHKVRKLFYEKLRLMLDGGLISYSDIIEEEEGENGSNEGLRAFLDFWTVSTQEDELKAVEAGLCGLCNNRNVNGGEN